MCTCRTGIHLWTKQYKQQEINKKIHTSEAGTSPWFMQTKDPRPSPRGVNLLVSFSLVCIVSFIFSPFSSASIPASNWQKLSGLIVCFSVFMSYVAWKKRAFSKIRTFDPVLSSLKAFSLAPCVFWTVMQTELILTWAFQAWAQFTQAALAPPFRMIDK